MIIFALAHGRFAEMVRDCEETGLPKYKLFASLGQCVITADPPQKDRLTLLNMVGGCGWLGVVWWCFKLSALCMGVVWEVVDLDMWIYGVGRCFESTVGVDLQRATFSH